MRRLLAVVIAALILVGCRRESAPQAPPPERPPIILISIDTLRADHLPGWGYRGVETPAIDSLRRDGVLFRNAWSHVPLTLPSHLSILTGLLPSEHGVRDNLGYAFDPKQHPPVTLALRANGYESGAAVSAYVLRGATGLAGAFDFYDDAVTARAGQFTGSLQRPGTASAAIAKSWISERAGRPFFFLLHLFEPHTPYEPPELLRARYPNRYDGEIAAADAIVGDFISSLKASGLYDKALIILLSDHGEGLGDHGESEHGVLLYREAIHVPLIIKLPRNARAGETVDEHVQLIDVAPTIAEAAGASHPGSRGRSLLGAGATPRPVYSETLYPRLHFGWSELRSLVEGPHHFIEGPKAELFDLRSDPMEKKNLAPERRREFALSRKKLAEFPKGSDAPAAVDPETAKKLAALGYIGSGAQRADPTANPRDRIEEFEALRKAIALQGKGSPEELIRLYRAVVAKNPDSIDARGFLAAAHEAAGQFDAAEREYKEALQRQPAIFEELALSLASLQLKMGKLAEAEANATLCLDRQRGRASQILASIALAREDFAGAEARLGNPEEDGSLRSYVVLAYVRAKQGRVEDAIALLEQTRSKAAVKGIDVEMMNYGLGDLYLTTGRPREAEAALREELRAFPNNLQAWVRLSRALAMQGRRDEARSALEDMVSSNPGQRARALAAAAAKDIR